MPLDTRQAIFIEGETRIYYKCWKCKKAKNILHYDTKALSHLEKCRCETKHYQQDLSLQDLPPYNPLENWR